MEYELLSEKIIGCAYRVYNKMGFGFLEKVYEKCLLIVMLKNFKEIGIIANMFCMIGFPTETRDEAMATKEFINKYRDYLKGNISLAPFLLQTDSEVFLNPEKYKIEKIFKTPEDVFSIIRNYQVNEGLSQEEALGILYDIWNELEIKYLENNFLYEMLEKGAGK